MGGRAPGAPPPRSANAKENMGENVTIYFYADHLIKQQNLNNK